MSKFKSFAFAIISASLITACSNSADEETENAPAQVLYEQSQMYLQDENYDRAISYLNALNSRFFYTAYQEQAQLDLIYAYYQSKDYKKAISTIETFLQKYHTSTSVPYAIYMMGLSNTALNNNWTQDFFSLDPANRDIASMKAAFANFRLLTTQFPNSPYTPDALKRMAYIQDMLARHQLNVAKFYAKRHAYVAVANRITDMFKKYPDTEATFMALPLLEKAYKKMGLTELAEKTHELIEANKDKKPQRVEKPQEPTVKIPTVHK